MDDVNLGLLFIRVIVGLVFAAHGVAKIRGGLSGVASWFESEGLRPGKLHASLAAYTEIAAGLALAVGVGFPLTNAAMVGVMAVAGFIGHRKNGFFIIRDGWEYVFVLGVVAAGLAATGPGEWSVDDALGWELDGIAGLAIAGVGGVAAALGLLAVFFTAPSAED